MHYYLPTKLCMHVQYVEELNRLGEAKSGVFNLLVTHVCDTWLKWLIDYTQTAIASHTGCHKDDIVTPSPLMSKSGDPPGTLPPLSSGELAAVRAVIASMKAHTDLLLKAATFGPVHKKNIRSVNSN